MPFLDITDVGTTPRRKLTPRQRLKVWERTGGVCVLCERKIDAVRERWIVEHIRALELGGADHLTNMGPAHEACAVDKTRDDHRRAARAKRQKIRHLGADVSKRPLPCGRNSPWKRTVAGQIVPR
jgi:5-methylcytosine-specific restriction endonuclease McrA